MKPDEPIKSPFGDGKLSEVLVEPDGTWTAFDATGKRIDFLDVDDHEVIEALLRYRYEWDPIR
jgi:hypothetical protein